MAPALAQPPLEIALVFSVDMTANDETLKQACLSQSERAISAGRYKDGDLADTPRDLSKDMQCYWDAEVCKVPEPCCFPVPTLLVSIYAFWVFEIF